MLGDREIWFTESSTVPTGTPPNGVPSNIALPGQVYNFRPSSILSKLWMYTASLNGSNVAVDKVSYVDNYLQDQTSPPVEHWLTYQNESVIVQANVDKGDNTIILNAGAGSTIVGIENNGYFLEIRYVNHDNQIPITRFYQAEIVTYTDNVTSVTVEMDTPLDFNIDTTYIESSYIVDANASRVSVNATTANRLTMCTFPPDDLGWDLTRLMVAGIFDREPDDAKFLDQSTPLTWGIYFGFESPTYSKYLANVKSNAGFRSSAYDVQYITRSSPQSSYGISVRKTFGGQDKYGVVVRLTGNQDKFCVWLQESWDTGNGLPDDVRFKIMGHEVE